MKKDDKGLKQGYLGSCKEKLLVFDKFTYWLIDYGLKSIIQMEKYAMRDGVVYIWVPSNVMMDAMQIDGVNDGHAQYILRDYPF